MVHDQHLPCGRHYNCYASCYVFRSSNVSIDKYTIILQSYYNITYTIHLTTTITDNYYTQCKLPECQCSICAHDWMKEDHQYKLQMIINTTMCARTWRIHARLIKKAPPVPVAASYNNYRCGECESLDHQSIKCKGQCHRKCNTVGKVCALMQVALMAASSRAGLDLVSGGGGGCSCMLLLPPAPKFADSNSALYSVEYNVSTK